ncbi:flagellar hook-associated protein FlgK [Paenibacillus rigui]|uniref:Flagellar hook-associated protein 1 n=1 Tax=Paenibacillus rigui TaxID=554312 RepID=A0A229UT84_9BACL|nr:flagellar hook-associated protein FlgK [Paenibacillus rigui]OXM86365.1 flagellar hook-associated protein FlgK [Paenibacillus rigui]
MRSTFSGIEISKRALFTQQAAINTTGHNIANSNTEGYSRQVVNMNAARPIEYPGLQKSTVPGQMGQGVEFNSVTRIRQQFLDDQFRNENKQLGSYTVQNDTLDKLQSIMNEPSDSGIRTVLDNFWKSWTDLSKDPENVTGRKIVRENAVALADAFNTISKQLNDLSNDLTSSIDTKATQVNSLSSSIASLNNEITRIEALGDDANDLRDQRDLLTDQLSKVVNIQVTNTPDGYNIDIGGTNLVTGKTSNAITSVTLTGAYTSGYLNSGEVYGMIVSKDKYVADYKNQLDTLANSIATGNVQVTLPAGSVIPDGTVLNGITYTGSVSARTLGSDLSVTVAGINGLHKLGYTFASPAKAGLDFFTSSSGAITAGTFQLNQAIADNPNLIATSMRTDDSTGTEQAVKGNNTLANLISQLKESQFTFNTTGTNGTVISSGKIDDYFGAIVGQLGVQAESLTRQVTNQKAIVEQIDSSRQSVSGVSLDEEMSNLIKFQHAYGAASRFMTTIDQVLDKLINSTGVVGR